MTFHRPALLPELKDKSLKLVLDGAAAHKRLDIRAYCHFNDIEIVWMPGYSPEFNSIESLWSVIKARVKHRLVEVSDVWIDQEHFVEMLTSTLDSVTPEAARKAAGNNRGYLHSLLLQMQRLQLTDSNLETLHEVDIIDEESVDSLPVDDFELMPSINSSPRLDVGAFLASSHARDSQASARSQQSSPSRQPRPHVFDLV